MKGFSIVGTDTEVGKTLIGGLIAAHFRDLGYRVGVFKPVESGVDDGWFLKKMSGDPAPIEEIVVYSLKYPVAPYVSSIKEGIHIDRKKILDVFRKRLGEYDVMICEGAGGLYVPISEDFMVSDLVVDFKFPAIVVTRSNLGAINHTLLTVKALRNLGVEIIGVVINHLKKDIGLAEKSLRSVLERFLDVDILGEFFYLESDPFSRDSLLKFRSSIDLEKLGA